jgi:hypothetical protein
MEQMLGQIVAGYSAKAVTNVPDCGFAEFIWLAVPTSTTITAGLWYTWDGATFNVTVVPTAVTSLGGAPVCVAINAVTSNASSVQYTWFQVTGRVTTLRAPTAGNFNVKRPILISGTTAGRIQSTASVFRTIIGARTANTATVTSGTSAITVYLNRPNIAPGI